MKRLLLLPIIALALFACQKNEPDDLFGGKTLLSAFSKTKLNCVRNSPLQSRVGNLCTIRTIKSLEASSF